MNPPVDPHATVLLVDDEETLRELFSDALQPDFQTDRAGSVKEAEALLKERTYKVVVSDHNMPGGDGLSFLARVRKKYPATVRLLVTNHLESRFLPSLSEAEPFRYLLKPISVPDLRKAVRDATALYDQGAAAR
ncbi:MAG: response regulator [Lacunisphaera sp.]|nr:response regulator [Lacunisphaera sp.]